MTLRLFMLVALLVQSVGASVFYVDFSAGNDSSAGTSTGTAWKTIPGTRNTADSGFQTASYGGGTISTSSKVQPGDTIRIKRGNTHGSSNGGVILISTSYYSSSATMANPFTFLSDPTWGSGSVTFDGNGVTLGLGGGEGIFHIQLGGVKVDGSTSTNGFIFKNSTFAGISAYPPGGNNIVGPSVYSSYFTNNGTSYGTSEVPGSEADADLKLLRSQGGEVLNCTMDGPNSIEGIICGESTLYVTNYYFSNIYVMNHPGSDDGGIGIKAFNSQIAIYNSTFHNCHKGWDLGEQNGGNVTINYKVIGCNTYSNYNGGNFNCAGGSSYTGEVKFYEINCVNWKNQEYGTKMYAGPFSAYVIGCTFDANGGSNFQDGNLGITCDNNASTDDRVITAVVYNNIFHKSNGNQSNMGVEYYVQNSNKASYDMDYNCWIQKSSEAAITWAGISGGLDSQTFPYGANGPGHASGNWYSWYSYNTTPPNSGFGTGHFHCDQHSKGTGASDTSVPSFTSLGGHDYSLTAHLAGTDISGKSWYISDMGKDILGATRVLWDMGAYELGGGGGGPPGGLLAPVGLSVTRVSGSTPF